MNTDLIERGQRLHAEARRRALEMGTRYLCHPANRVRRLWPFKEIPQWLGK